MGSLPSPNLSGYAAHQLNHSHLSAQQQSQSQATVSAASVQEHVYHHFQEFSDAQTTHHYAVDHLPSKSHHDRLLSAQSSSTQFKHREEDYLHLTDQQQHQHVNQLNQQLTISPMLAITCVPSSPADSCNISITQYPNPDVQSTTTHNPNPIVCASHNSNGAPDRNPNVNPSPKMHDTAIPPSLSKQLEGDSAASLTGNKVTGSVDVKEELCDGYEHEKEEIIEDRHGVTEAAEVVDAATGSSRWPKEEALTLLKIRCDMDYLFRDACPKGPLWEAVSRKMIELGYRRSAKKCREKFENVNKYYKRTKEARAGRQNGKNYRFFSELEALYRKTLNREHNEVSCNDIPAREHSRPVMQIAYHQASTSLASLHKINPDMATPAAYTSPTDQLTFISASTFDPVTRSKPKSKSISDHSSSDLNLSDPSSNDDDGGDDDADCDVAFFGGSEAAIKENAGLRVRKRKRKPTVIPPKKYFALFDRAMRRLLHKQEQMQQKFLQALERRDKEMTAREEAWKRQEMARISTEVDLRTQERMFAASRDAAFVTFLQNLTGQAPMVAPQTAIQAKPLSISPSPFGMTKDYRNECAEHCEPSGKKWPKPEVMALIGLRVAFDAKFHEPGSKLNVWEEISAAMASQGFSKSAKKCREKWENINKYYRKAKESNRKRSENAKTCPYYHELDLLYSEGVLGPGKQFFLEKTEGHDSGKVWKQNRQDGARLHDNLCRSDDGEEAKHTTSAQGGSQLLPAAVHSLNGNGEGPKQLSLLQPNFDASHRALPRASQGETSMKSTETPNSRAAENFEA